MRIPPEFDRSAARYNGKVKFGFEVGTVPVGAPRTTALAAPTALPLRTATPPTAARPSAPRSSAARPSAGAGRVTVPGPDLAARVTSLWRQQNGSSPFPVTCPNLRGVVGATAVCKLTSRGQRYTITVTATSVSGTDVGFSFTSRPA